MLIAKKTGLFRIFRNELQNQTLSCNQDVSITTTSALYTVCINDTMNSKRKQAIDKLRKCHIAKSRELVDLPFWLVVQLLLMLLGDAVWL